MAMTLLTWSSRLGAFAEELDGEERVEMLVAVDSLFEPDVVSELVALVLFVGASSMSTEVPRWPRWDDCGSGFVARGLDWPLFLRPFSAGASTSICSFAAPSMSECSRFAGDDDRGGGRGAVCSGCVGLRVVGSESVAMSPLLSRLSSVRFA
jgi:hypothetical protein